jgi:uncharacterized protein YyaL (SSP411 family)
MSNQLSKESSPYLLQHANNPINWYAWNNDTLALAKKENKIILVSIGYSACHWCHVMEHESFEDEMVAKIMNENFINIKVDREERPDIDMVYMGAVQLMTGQGGWPLNCFALPDGRPIYGGTYFPKHQWINVLNSISDLFKTNPEKVYEYAENLTDGLNQLEIPKSSLTTTFEIETLYKSVNKWKTLFDNENGGPNRAPKFPLPNNYLFFLNYSFYQNDLILKKHLDLTLRKMAIGGIYDQLGGGFARYSTDVYWKVPHFEKMLYDNAQLISLYSQAYKQTNNTLYKQVVYETIDFVTTELTNKKIGFYSALDADTDGIEGKYYVWQKEEIHRLLKENFEVFADYYCVNEMGYWEDDNYVLMRNDDDATVATKHNLSISQLQQNIEKSKKILLQEREKRTKPGLDNKIIASWNGLMCKALTEAYLIFDEEKFKTLAISNANFLLTHYYKNNGKLLRVVNKNTVVYGFLEDYAFVIDAFINVYTITGNKDWLYKAKELADYTLNCFYDKKQNTYFFTDSNQEKLIVRKAEWSDNVIPSSSSQMAINLYKLSVYFNETTYREISNNLLKTVIKEIENYGSGYSNWAILLLQNLTPQTEVAIVGKNVNEIIKKLYKQSPPNVIFALSSEKSDLPMLINRYVENETLIYVCKNYTCLAPTKSVEEALKQIEEGSK